MPIFSGNALGIGVGMDGKDLGMPLRTGRVRVNVQLAETAPERLVAFHVKRLIAKEQDLVLRQRLVQPVDLGANAGRDRRDIDSFIAHGATFPCGKIDHIELRVTAYLAENLLYPQTGARASWSGACSRLPFIQTPLTAYSTFAALMIGLQRNSPMARSCC